MGKSASESLPTSTVCHIQLCVCVCVCVCVDNKRTDLQTLEGRSYDHTLDISSFSKLKVKSFSTLCFKHIWHTTLDLGEVTAVLTAVVIQADFHLTSVSLRNC